MLTRNVATGEREHQLHGYHTSRCHQGVTDTVESDMVPLGVAKPITLYYVPSSHGASRRQIGSVHVLASLIPNSIDTR